LELVRALKFMQCNVTLLSLYDKTLLAVPDGIPLYFMYQKRPRYRALRKKEMRSKLKSTLANIEADLGAIDLVITGYATTIKLLERLSTPYAVVVHNSPRGALMESRAKSLFKYLKHYLFIFPMYSGKHLVTVSEGIEKEVGEDAKLRPLSMKTIYNPFNLEEVQRRACEEAAGLPKEKYIIHSGRFGKQKRQDILMQALPYINSEYKLVFLCNAVDRLQELAEKRKFIGFVF